MPDFMSLLEAAARFRAIEQLDAATQAFRSGLDHGQRVPHIEHW